MIPLKHQLAEDRALRDAALALVKADAIHLKQDLANRGIGARVIDRVNEGAVDLFEDATEIADDNRGILFMLLSAVLLWFARNPIIAMFSNDDRNAEFDSELDR